MEDWRIAGKILVVALIAIVLIVLWMAYPDDWDGGDDDGNPPPPIPV